MNIELFDYFLPEELIAQTPTINREDSRLLVLDQKSGNISDQVFPDIFMYFNKGDCLVLNDTKVIPARIFGKKVDTLSKIEFLLLKKIDKDQWEVLLKPGKKAKIGAEFNFSDKLYAKVIEIKEDGNRIVRFKYDGVFEEILDEIGVMPLPPYITEKLDDKSRYQTVYSKNKGSSAAPTAGLHFTNKILDELKSRGIEIAYATLHVGLGTFRPVKVENIYDHKMHSEYFSIEKSEVDKINKSKLNGGKIISVGTTSCRVLETLANENGLINCGNGNTDIFIYPGYKFKIVDMLITNFHLPKSTLLMLVSALAGRENILKAYNHAVKEKYRFFSFGDAMLIK